MNEYWTYCQMTGTFKVYQHKMYNYIICCFFFLLKKENAEPCNLFKGIWGTDIKSTHTKMSEKYLQHRFCVADTLCACFCQAELFTQREPVDINTPENR